MCEYLNKLKQEVITNIMKQCCFGSVAPVTRTHMWTTQTKKNTEKFKGQTGKSIFAVNENLDLSISIKLMYIKKYIHLTNYQTEPAKNLIINIKYQI